MSGALAHVDADAAIRSEVKAGIKSVRAQWREQATAMQRLSPSTKIGKRASLLMLDIDSLDDRIAEAGGEDALAFLICAHVASGATLTTWCEHYLIERGLVWAFLSENEARLQRYYRALEGVADEYVGEVVGIADNATNENVAVDRLRIDSRLKVAGKYSSARFGEKSGASVLVGNFPTNIAVTFVEAANGKPAIEGERA